MAAAVDDLVTAVGERMHAALAAPLLLDGVVLQVTGGIYVALLQSYRRANLVATKPLAMFIVVPNAAAPLGAGLARADRRDGVQEGVR